MQSWGKKCKLSHNYPFLLMEFSFGCIAYWLLGGTRKKKESNVRLCSKHEYNNIDRRSSVFKEKITIQEKNIIIMKGTLVLEGTHDLSWDKSSFPYFSIYVICQKINFSQYTTLIYHWHTCNKSITIWSSKQVRASIITGCKKAKCWGGGERRDGLQACSQLGHKCGRTVKINPIKVR